MHHREGVEPPTRTREDQTAGNGAQAVTAVLLGPDHVGKIATYERHRFAAAVDLDRATDAVESECCEQACETQHMVEMRMGQQHVLQAAKPELGAHQLALGPLAAIDQEPLRATG